MSAIALGYSGIGALQWSSGTTLDRGDEQFKTDALGNRLWVRDWLVPGVDRSKYFTITASTGQLESVRLGTPCFVGQWATGQSCHPTEYFYSFDQEHDQEGNVTATWSAQNDAPLAPVTVDESRSYYAADGKLAYFNSAGTGGQVFEEHRYDALGRRVLTRGRRPFCVNPCEQFVQRTVWDGDQVLYEIRARGGDTTAVDLETEFVSTPDGAHFYGIVGYAHATGIDQPVGVVKRDPESETWWYLTPHANWRGEWSAGTDASGGECTSPAANCPNWPGFARSMDGAAVAPPTFDPWWGSILRGGIDASGLQYLRNRYYDPKSGRFAQEDPIGLAGGLNLYRFAAGDPVNFSDPFGLCPEDLRARMTTRHRAPRPHRRPGPAPARRTPRPGSGAGANEPRPSHQRSRTATRGASGIAPDAGSCGALVLPGSRSARSGRARRADGYRCKCARPTSAHRAQAPAGASRLIPRCHRRLRRCGLLTAGSERDLFSPSP
jgi:hypothetical protein